MKLARAQRTDAEATTLTYRAAIERFVAPWDEQLDENRGATLHLDLSQIRIVHRDAGCALVNALLGRMGGPPLIVEGAEAPEELHRFADTGIPFALATRPGKVELPSRAAACLLKDDRWQRSSTWRSVNRGQGTLFSPWETGEDDDDPDWAGRRHAYFVNPHLAPRPARISHVAALVKPWLARLLPARPNTRRRSPLLDTLGSLIDELLANIREHTQGGWDVRSLIQVAVTSGESYRLHLSAHDTGPGIAATARPKLAPTESSTLEDAELVRRLFTGQLESFPPRRNLGLVDVLSRSLDFGASLRVHSGATHILFTDYQDPVMTTAVRLGTIIHITIPLDERLEPA